MGKKTCAHVIARAIGSRIHTAAASNLAKPASLVGIFGKMASLDVLLIDEIHRIPMVVQEVLCFAMEDYRLDVAVGTSTATEPLVC